MNGPVEVNDLLPGGDRYHRSAHVFRRTGENLTLRVTADDQRGFRAIEIHLTQAEAASLAEQLTGGTK